jgi:hypothetical protein
MGEGSKPKSADIRSRLLVDVIKLGLLNASNMTAGISEEGVNSVFTGLIIKSTGVPISDGDVRTDHSEDKKGGVAALQRRKTGTCPKKKTRMKQTQLKQPN